MTIDNLSLAEKCQELAREHGGRVSTALATLMLACQMNVAAQTTTPVSSADSALAASAKGYGQEVILKDGSKMSFGEIAKLGTKEQDVIIEGMEGAKNRLRLTRYLAEVANQTEKKIDENIQVANQETIQLRIANVAKLRIFAEKNGWKLSKSDEKYLKTIIEDGKPPIDEAKYILSRAIFA